MEIRSYQPGDDDAIVSLWERCDLTRPWNDPYADIRRKQSVQPGWFLVGVIEGQIVATVMAGYDGHRGWLYYLAVAPEHRGHGFGRAIVNRAEQLLLEAGCPKVNLMVRTENPTVVEFYQRLGYSVDAVVNMGRRLIPDQPRDA